MKKTIIALAVAGFSFSAVAADLTKANVAGAATGNSYPLVASEIVVPSTGLVITHANNLDTIVAADYAVTGAATTGTEIYVRFDLTNAKFNTTLTDASLTASNTTATPTANISVFDAKPSYVIFKVLVAAEESLVPADTFKLVIPSLNVAAKEDVSVKYTVFTDNAEAIGGTNPKVTTSGPIVSFAQAFDYSAVQVANIKKIDVTKDYLLFDSGTTSEAALFELKLATKAKNADGYAINFSKADLAGDLAITDLVGAGNTLVVAGDFAAAATFNGAATPFTTSSALSVSKATFNFAAPTANIDETFTLTVDEKTAINAGDYTAQLTLKDANAAEFVLAEKEIDLGTVATLVRTGGTAPIDLVMKPNGAFKHFVRVTNAAGTDATNVGFTVINDAGDVADINLADVAGQTSSVLAGNASSAQLSVNDIVAAAALKKPVFANVEGKIRLIVKGNSSDLRAQSYVLSSDNTALIKFD